MRIKGANEEDTLYLSDLILSVFWGDIRCSGRQRRNQQEKHSPLQTHPEKNKDENFLWWQIKKQGWQLVMMAKEMMTLPIDSSAGKQVKGVPLSKWFYIGGRHTWRPGLSAKWPSGQVARGGWAGGRETLTAVNFLARGHICTPRWWELLVTIDT